MTFRLSSRILVSPFTDLSRVGVHLPYGPNQEDAIDRSRVHLKEKKEKEAGLRRKKKGAGLRRKPSRFVALNEVMVHWFAVGLCLPCSGGGDMRFSDSPRSSLSYSSPYVY